MEQERGGEWRGMTECDHEGEGKGRGGLRTGRKGGERGA